MALGKAWPRRTFLGPSKMLSANACPAIVFAKTSSRHPIGVGPYGRALAIGKAINTVVYFLHWQFDYAPVLELARVRVFAEERWTAKSFCYLERLSNQSVGAL